MKTVKKNAVVFGSVIAAILMILSVTAVGINVKNTKPSKMLPETEVNVGHIIIDKEGDNPIVDCIGSKAFNINVGSGATVTVNVDYSIRCPGSADDGYVEISFSDGGDSDSFTYGGNTEITGTLTISKYVEPNEYFVVNLYGKYTDWYGTQTLGEDEDKGFGGSCNGLDVDTAFVWLSPSNPPGNIIDFTWKLPTKLDVGNCGSFVIFNVDYRNDYYDWPGHDINRVGIGVKDDFGLDLRAVVNDPPHYGNLSVYGFITPGKTLWVGIDGCAYDNSTMVESTFKETDTYWGVGNNPPTVTIDAPRRVKYNRETDIKFTANDPAGHDCYIMIDWIGTGFDWVNQPNYATDWLGPYKSGEIVTIPHTWTYDDSTFIYPFHLTAIAKDLYYLEGVPTEHILRAGWFGDSSVSPQNINQQNSQSNPLPQNQQSSPSMQQNIQLLQNLIVCQQTAK
jgi:hypothetical protein